MVAPLSSGTVTTKLALPRDDQPVWNQPFSFSGWIRSLSPLTSTTVRSSSFSTPFAATLGPEPVRTSTS